MTRLGTASLLMTLVFAAGKFSAADDHTDH